MRPCHLHHQHRHQRLGAAWGRGATRVHRISGTCSPAAAAAVSASAQLELTPINELLQRTSTSPAKADALGACILPRLPPAPASAAGASPALREAELVVELARDREAVRCWLDSGAQDVSPAILQALNRVIAAQRSLVAQAAGSPQAATLLADPALPLPAAADVSLQPIPSSSSSSTSSSSSSSPLGSPSGSSSSSSTAAALEWCCPLGVQQQQQQQQQQGGGSGRLGTRLRTLKQELGLMCFVLAAAMRQLALSKVGVPPASADGSSSSSSSSNSAPAGGGEGSGASAAGGAEAVAARQTEAVALLRQAAGVLQYSQTAVLAGLPEELQAQAVELNPSVAQLLSLMCLAEAQAVVICRASAKGSSAGALAGLEAGCARLFGTALELAGQAGVAPAPTSGLRLPFGLGLPRLGGGGGGAGGADGVAGAGARLLLVWQLGAYLAASEAYHRAAARQLQGRAAFQETEMGTATVLLTEAEAALQKAADAVKGAAGGKGQAAWPTLWAGQISARQQAVSTLKAESEKERLSVTLQPLLREPPALPEPKVLVTPGAPFVPALPVVAV